MNIQSFRTKTSALLQARNELQSTEHVPGELILGLEHSTAAPQDDLGESLGGEIVEVFDMGPTLASQGKSVVRLKTTDEQDLAQTLARARAIPGVAYAEPNEILRLSDGPTTPVELRPNDTERRPNDLTPGLWGLHNEENPGADISALEAWKVSTGSTESPLIAVIDSGADYNHPDLATNIARNPGEIPGDGIDNDGNGVIDDVFGYNAIDDNGDPLDRRGHGTHCTGTIAAVGHNGQGLVGVNWNARILPIKIFNDKGLTNVAAILRGINYARQRGAFITSNSWGGANFRQSIYDAFAATPGLHVTAAGNSSADNANGKSFPAGFDLPNLMAVGASNKQDEPATFSNYGRTTVHLFAPGRDILSTLPRGEYGLKSGTSMACPHVTGTAGLIASAFPSLSPTQIKDRLIHSTDPVPSVAELSISGGRLNAARALSEDSVAPAAPNDFVVTRTDTLSARFSWTGTGDDGWKNGAATAFEVRVSDQAITAENWSEATPLPTPRGQEIGDHHHVVFQQTPQKADRTVYAAFKAVDEVGNRSEMLTSLAVLPSTPIVLEDDFDKAESTWQGEGRWQQIDHPGRGKVWSCKPHKKTTGTYSKLTSPELDLSGSKDNFLRFESRQDFDYDSLVYLDISDDGGERWTRMDRLRDRGQWGKREYDLSAYDGKKIKLRISSEHLAIKDGEGTMIDNFEILGYPSDGDCSVI